jgi:hypothetical protein
MRAHAGDLMLHLLNQKMNGSRSVLFSRSIYTFCTVVCTRLTRNVSSRKPN